MLSDHFHNFGSSSSFEATEGLLSKDATASKQCKKNFTNRGVMDCNNQISSAHSGYVCDNEPLLGCC